MDEVDQLIALLGYHSCQADNMAIVSRRYARKEDTLLTYVGHSAVVHLDVKPCLEDLSAAGR